MGNKGDEERMGNRIGKAIVCPYCEWEHCDFREAEVPTDDFICDSCRKTFNVAVEEAITVYFNCSKKEPKVK